MTSMSSTIGTMKRVLEAVLSIEDECSELEQSLVAKNGGEIKLEEKTIAELTGQQQQLQTKADDVLARLFGAEDELEFLKSAHQKEGVECEAAITKEDKTLAEIEQVCQRLQTALEIKNDPERLLPVPPLTFPLINFQARKEDNEIWFSSPFYSHPYGYKMCLKVYTNGSSDGEGTHISAYIAILPGEFDDLLTWPFCGEVTFQLLNQRKDRGHKVFSINFDTPQNLTYRLKPDPSKIIDPNQASAWGCHTFAAHAALPAQGYFSDTEYLKNDSLQLRVSRVLVYNPHH